MAAKIAAPKNPIRVQIVGLVSLQRALNLVANGLDKLQTVHQAAAELVAGTAREIVPVQSGTLRGTIVATSDRSHGFVFAGTPGVPYAGPIHFGWPDHNIKPQPFLYDALDANFENVSELYGKHVDDLVRLVGKLPV